MCKRIMNIVSGAKSGALNVAVTVGAFLRSEGYAVDLILRKYNKADIETATVVKDRFTLDYICSLSEQIDERKPDVILVHGYSTHLWTKLALLKAKHKSKLIHVEHNVERYTPLRAHLLRKLDCCTQKYICVSRGVAASLRKFDLPEGKIQVIYNGIDLEKFSLPKQPQPVYTVGMVARFTRQKDQMTLIRAVEILIKERQMLLRLILMGEGKLKKECLRYVQQHGLTEYISFETGRFTDLIPRLDLFVLSTHYEGLPLVLCEAMAAGLPVVATDVAGVDEIIEDGVNGFLVAETDSKALADKISYCMRNAESEKLALCKQRAGERIAAVFALRKMCMEYKAAVEGV